MTRFRQRTAGLAAMGLAIAIQLAAAQADFDDLSRRAADSVDAHPAQAAELYRQALALRPDWAEGWFYLGTSLFQLHQFADARDALRKAQTLQPRKGTVVAFLGMAEYELGDHREALSDILKGEDMGLAENPPFVAAVHYRAALICLQASDFVQALAQLRTLVKAGNESDPVIQALGLCTLNIASTPEQVPAGRRPLIEAAGHAAWEFEAQHPDKAGSRFDELVAKFSNEPGVHYMDGVYLLDRDPRRAEEEFRKELQIAPANVDARVQLAQLLIKRDAADEAVKTSREAVRLQPDNALCQATLGRALLSAGQTNEAIAALEQAEKLAPGAAPTHLYLEQAYRRAGRISDAQKEKELWQHLRVQQEPETIPQP